MSTSSRSRVCTTSTGSQDTRSVKGSRWNTPLVAVIMGSKSDWETMRHADEMLTRFGVPHESSIVSAHRTPQHMAEFAASAESRGIEVIIAGAGGAAHLPGMVAAQTLVPVLGVPVESHALKGMDSLLSIVQMPGGIPVGTLAIGKPARPMPRFWPLQFSEIPGPTSARSFEASAKNRPSKVRQDTLA